MDLKIVKETPPWEWPEDAGKMFLRVLRDDEADESERLLAAELAGDTTVIDDELADALLSIVSSGGEAERLRATAAISFGPALELADEEGFDDFGDAPISEVTFDKIQESLGTLYGDTGVPKEVRRRILEASVRAPLDWHEDAIRAAYANDDEDWKLTSVFCMCWVDGFEDQILEALKSENSEIHFQAVCAAGAREIDAAWPHVAALVSEQGDDKDLLLAAIDAAAGIRPDEAGTILVDLTEDEDGDIAEAAREAMAMAEIAAGDEYDDLDDDFLAEEESGPRLVR